MGLNPFIFYSKMIKLFSMFSGYGGAEFALRKANIPFECVGFSEIDKFAIQCYLQNHGNIKNFEDATKINPNEIPDFDLLTAGFPCQSFSVAGKNLGELESRGTLFNEIIRVAEVKQPRWMLLENVKGLTNKKHKATFEKIIFELARIGYIVSWRILNSKKYGTPQNRERVFFACFRQQEDYMKFIWPEKKQLNLLLKDILESNVDEKYYLKEETVQHLLNKDGGFKSKLNPEIGSCQFATQYKQGRGIDLIQLNNPIHSNNRVYSSDGDTPSLNTIQGGNRQPFIVASRGRNPNNPSDRTSGAPTEQRLEPNFDGVSNNLTSVQKDNWLFDGRVRKLTPKECFRLMGFFNDEINLDGISNSQRYKLAGNGWDINLVSQIFERLLK